MTMQAQLLSQDATLPNGWRLAKIGEVCTVHPGQHILEVDYNRDMRGIGYMTGPADFSAMQGVISKWTESPKTFCEPSDVLVTVKGAGVGKLNLAPTDRCAIGRQLMAIRPINGLMDQFFLFLLLTTQFAKLQSTAIGATVPGLGRGDIESLEVVLPPLAEQKRIAGILKEQLAAVEQARTAATAQLEAAKALPAAYLREVFDREDEAKWPYTALKEIADIRGGVQKTPNRRPIDFHRPYLTVRNVQRGYLELSQLEHFELTPDELETLRLSKGDLLIVEGNGSRNHIGRNAIFDGCIKDCVHQNHIIRVRLDPAKASPQFVSRFLNSSAGMAQMVEKAQTTSGLFTLSAQKVGSLTVPLPPVHVQDEVVRSIADELSVGDQLSSALTDQLKVVNALPAALLRSAFRGKL